VKKNFQKKIKYWQESSSKDFKAAESLFKKKLYPQSLFFCHLSLEKMFKSLIMKRIQKFPPYIHDLRRLTEIGKIDLTEEKEKILDEISIFNIIGRYPEEKFEFYKKYNKKEIAKKYLKITKELILWLKKEFQKK